MVVKILPQYFQALKIYKDKVLQHKLVQSLNDERLGALIDLCLQNIIMWRNEHVPPRYGNVKEIIIDDYLYFVHTTLPVTWEVTRMHLHTYTMAHGMVLPVRMKIVLLYHLYLKGME